LLSDEETEAALRGLLFLAGHRNLTAPCHANVAHTAPAASPANCVPVDQAQRPVDTLQMLEADSP